MFCDLHSKRAHFLNLSTVQLRITKQSIINNCCNLYRRLDMKRINLWRCAEITYVVILLSALAYIFMNAEQVHVHIVKAFAYLGQQDAQHILGQRYYVGKGVERNKTLAFYWFHQAADQGHIHASYNLAVGHIQGFHRRLKKGEAHKLIRNAAEKGVSEAAYVLEKVCKKGHCDF